MIVSLHKWRDLEDKHLYEAGDVFPHDGREISAERIAELTTAQNKAGFALIQQIEEAEAPKKRTTRGKTK